MEKCLENGPDLIHDAVLALDPGPVRVAAAVAHLDPGRIVVRKGREAIEDLSNTRKDKENR